MPEKKGRIVSPAAMALLNGLCAVVWAYHALTGWRENPLVLAASIGFLLGSVSWGAQACRAGRGKREHQSKSE